MRRLINEFYLFFIFISTKFLLSNLSIRPMRVLLYLNTFYLSKKFETANGHVILIHYSLHTFRITQTRPNRADKCIQTGQRVDEQPIRLERHDDWESGSSTLSDEDAMDYDSITGKRIVPPSARRYIYTVFD